MSKYVDIMQDALAAAKYIAAGRVVAFPTGTSYGLAIDATQGWALQRLKNLKERPAEKSFTVFLADRQMHQYVNISSDEQAWLDKHKNEAVTLLVKPKPELEHLAQDNLVGLRIIDHPLMKKFAEAVDVPLTATSANKSEVEPCFSPDCIIRTFPSVMEDGPTSPSGLRGAGTTYDLSLAAILDGGELEKKEPSQIVKIQDDQVEIVRA